MPFPPKKTDDTTEPSQDSPTQNPFHEGGHGAHAPNGHHTPAKQAEHQAALNQNHGAGTGLPPRDGEDPNC